MFCSVLFYSVLFYTVYVPCGLPLSLISLSLPFHTKKLESNLKQFADCAVVGDDRDNTFYFVATDEAATQALASKVRTSWGVKCKQDTALKCPISIHKTHGV